jgi:hypothetical protein
MEVERWRGGGWWLCFVSVCGLFVGVLRVLCSCLNNCLCVELNCCISAYRFSVD